MVDSEWSGDRFVLNAGCFVVFLVFALITQIVWRKSDEEQREECFMFLLREVRDLCEGHACPALSSQ